MASKPPTNTPRPSAAKRRRPNIREQQKQLTREVLLAGAAEAFAEAGYNDVTIDDIAMRAGTSRGTFYLYFTKGKILAELIERAFAQSIGGSSRSALLPDISTAAPYDVESLHRWIESYVKTWEKNRDLVRAWMEGDVTDPEVQAITRRRISRAVELLTGVLLEHQRQAGLDTDEETVRARAVLMDLQLQYFCFYFVVRRMDINRQAGIRALAEQWHGAIHYGLTSPVG